jgi:hypothetical protein
MNFFRDANAQGTFSRVVLALLELRSTKRKSTHIDNVDNLLGVFCSTSAVSSDVNIAFGDEYVTRWHGDMLGDILVRLAIHLYLHSETSSYFLERIIRNRNWYSACLRLWTLLCLCLRLIKDFRQRLIGASWVRGTGMTVAGANSAILFPSAGFALANLRFGFCCRGSHWR